MAIFPGFDNPGTLYNSIKPADFDGSSAITTTSGRNGVAAEFGEVSFRLSFVGSLLPDLILPT